MTTPRAPDGTIPDDFDAAVLRFAERSEQIRTELARVVQGQQDVAHGVLTALFCGGHVLLEGAPGLGKTLLARSVARVLGCRFKRIQFTPDLMPADVTGGNVYNQRDHAFEFLPGPVFTEVLLADEINRSPARTQAALLESMGDRQVTIDGVTRRLPRPFFAIATQNPVESEGTWALPEAQLDRFLLKLVVQPPDRTVEVAILEQHLAGFDAAALDREAIAVVMEAGEVVAWQDTLRRVRATRPILEYTADLVARSREHRALYLGASPRASIGLLLAAQVEAASQGRAFVIPDDIKALAPAVLRHRLMLLPEAEMEGTTVEDVIRDLVVQTPVPDRVT